MIFKQRLFIFLIILILCSPLSAFSSRKKVKVVKEEEMQIEEPSENTDDLNITDETVQEVIIEPSTESYTKKTQPQKTKTTQKTQRTLTEQEKQEEKERQEKLAKQMELALEKEKKKSGRHLQGPEVPGGGHRGHAPREPAGRGAAEGL